MRRSSSSSLAPLMVAGALIAALGCAAGCASRASSTAGSGASQGSPSGDIDAAAPASTDDAPVTTNAFDCSGPGIAAYADQLANKAKTSCTQDGAGVVKKDDYTCMSWAINQVNPPYGSASFNVVSTLLATNTEYPFYECILY